MAELPEVFEPVQGGWGRMGMTYVVLERADEATMRGALGRRTGMWRRSRRRKSETGEEAASR